jgi:zinc D-Ala-D-Ala dipeptidase
MCCKHGDDETIARSAKSSNRLKYTEINGCNSPLCYYDAVMRKHKLIDIKIMIPDIHVDLKYASTDNFMEMNLYCCLRKAYLQPAVALMLEISQKYLQELHPGYSLVVYDAARPLQIQQLMWDKLQLPVHEKIRFLSNPRFGSIHNFGAAVDVSIIDLMGKELDMGTTYDHIGEEAWPVLENRMLQERKLTVQQLENRQLLKNVMRTGGFWGIQTEWWHFNAMTRDEARHKYQLIQ